MFNFFKRKKSKEQENNKKSDKVAFRMVYAAPKMMNEKDFYNNNAQSYPHIHSISEDIENIENQYNMECVYAAPKKFK